MAKQRTEISYIHFMHRELWNGRELLIQQSQEVTAGGYAKLAALAFSQFALEAYLNFVIHAMDPQTWRDERNVFVGDLAGVVGKLRWVMQKLGLTIEEGTRPFQTLVELNRRRHEIVHPLPVQGRQVVSHRPEDPPPYVDKGFDRIVDDAFLARTGVDVQAVCDRIHVAAASQAGHGLVTGTSAFLGAISHQWGWSGQAETQS